MKPTFLFFCIIVNLRLGAQSMGGISPGNFFDPERDPVALRSDSTLQLLVSEYLLAKSVKARIGQTFQVTKIFKNKQRDGSHYLMFEGHHSNGQIQMLAFGVRLMPDVTNRFYYLNSVADQTCGVAGCGNCSIVNRECVGCCPNTTTSIATPLLKVQSTIDE